MTDYERSKTSLNNEAENGGGQRPEAVPQPKLGHPAQHEFCQHRLSDLLWPPQIEGVDPSSFLAFRQSPNDLDRRLIIEAMESHPETAGLVDDFDGALAYGLRESMIISDDHYWTSDHEGKTMVAAFCAEDGKCHHFLAFTISDTSDPERLHVLIHAMIGVLSFGGAVEAFVVLNEQYEPVALEFGPKGNPLTIDLEALFERTPLGRAYALNLIGCLSYILFDSHIEERLKSVSPVFEEA